MTTDENFTFDDGTNMGDEAAHNFMLIQSAYCEAMERYEAALHAEIRRVCAEDHPTAVRLKIQGEYTFGGFTVSLSEVFDADGNELEFDATFENAVWELLDQLGTVNSDYQGDYTYYLPIAAGTCRYCGNVIRYDGKVWIDLSTNGDVCGWAGGNEPHAPKAP